MLKLIEISSGNTIANASDPIYPPGVDRAKIDDGRYKWIEVPQGVDPLDCVLDNSNPEVPVLVYNQAAHDARVAAAAAVVTQANQLETYKQRFLALDLQSDLTAAELKELVRKMFKYLKMRGLFD